MISQTSEYALRTILYLATRSGEPATTRQIAQPPRVPASYLAKVLHSLSCARLIKSQRGPHGGSVLYRPSSDISVYDVIAAVDCIHRIGSCPLSLQSHGSQLCPLHRRLDDAMAMIERAFRQSSIADLLGDQSPIVPLCEVS
jgi:Rrf2 family nitric oxide-sensitive transcriptional repressor